MKRTRLTKLTLALAVAAILLLSAERTLAGGFSISFGTPARSSRSYTTRGTAHGHSQTSRRVGYTSVARSYSGSGCRSGCRYCSRSRTSRSTPHHGYSRSFDHRPAYGHQSVILRKPVYRPTYRIPIILFGWSW